MPFTSDKLFFVIICNYIRIGICIHINILIGIYIYCFPGVDELDNAV